MVTRLLTIWSCGCTKAFQIRMPSPFALMDFFIWSLTVNVLILINQLSERLLEYFIFSNPMWTGVVESNEITQNFEQFENRISRTPVRVIIGLVSPIVGVYLFLDSGVTTHPFDVKTPAMTSFFTVQLAFHSFEFLVPFLTKNKPFSGYSEILCHAFLITIYLSAIVTKENALLGLIGLFTVADLLMQEVISIFQYFPKQKKKISYLVCLFLSAVSMGTFWLIMPFVTLSVTVAYSAAQLRNLLSISVGIFFFSVIFILFYNIWFYVTGMCFLYKEFKAATPGRQRVKKNLELRFVSSFNKKTSDDNFRSVSNEYFFDIGQTGFGLTNNRKSAEVFVISDQADYHDNEPTHFYI